MKNNNDSDVLNNPIGIQSVDSTVKMIEMVTANLFANAVNGGIPLIHIFKDPADKGPFLNRLYQLCYMSVLTKIYTSAVKRVGSVMGQLPIPVQFDVVVGPPPNLEGSWADGWSIINNSYYLASNIAHSHPVRATMDYQAVEKSLEMSGYKSMAALSGLHDSDGRVYPVSHDEERVVIYLMPDPWKTSNATK